MATKYDEKPCSNLGRPVVSVTKTVSVHPKTPSHPTRHHEILSLSNLDRQCPTLMYSVLFYKIVPISDHTDNNNNNLDDRCVFESLKSGLEETLAIWYPAAGRLTFHSDDPNPNPNPNDDGASSCNKLNLWCNNKGAILAEAITEAKISDLGDLSHYNHFFESLVFKPHFHSDFSDMPLVVAQVTKFGCGGYSIGLGTSHSLFDGPAAFNFLSAWASSSDTMKENKPPRLETFKPVHDRSTLLTLGANSTSKGMNEKMLSQIDQIDTNSDNINFSDLMMRATTGAAAIDHLLQMIMQSASDHKGNYNEKDLVLKTFHLSGSFVEGLKRKVLEEDSGFSCSSFEVVAALLWKARTKAMGVNKEEMACLQFAVDTRKKVAPPLPSGFSGNAYVLASAATTAGELESLSYKAAVEKIREAKGSVDNDYVKAYMAGLVQGPPSLPPLKALTLVSDWTRMPFHTLDFFPGLGPACVAPLVPPIPQVAYFMQSPRDPLAVDVRIGLFPANLDAFSTYFLT